MSTAGSLITFAEFEQLPDVEGYKRELVNGELVTMPPPELNHSELARRILSFLFDRFDRRRVWPDHTGYRIGGGWLAPDVSISWPDQRRDAKYFVRSPIIAIEILSPGEDWAEKLDTPDILRKCEKTKCGMRLRPVSSGSARTSGISGRPKFRVSSWLPVITGRSSIQSTAISILKPYRTFVASLTLQACVPWFAWPTSSTRWLRGLSIAGRRA